MHFVQPEHYKQFSDHQLVFNRDLTHGVFQGPAEIIRQPIDKTKIYSVPAEEDGPDDPLAV